MLQVQSIDTLDLPELAPYRTMRRTEEHRKNGIFVAEGEKVIRRLLESSLSVVSLLAPERWVRDLEPLIRKRAGTIRVFAADKKLLEQLTGFSMYQGLLAVGRVPEPTTLDHLLHRRKQPYLFVAVDGISSAENLGSIVRNCGAFGVHGLLVGRTSCSPFLRRAVRSSMGVIFSLPVVEGQDLPVTLQELRDRGIRCIAAHPRTSSRPLVECGLQADCCLVFGSEGPGISDEVINVCDELVAIPMSSNVDSLNVANAAVAFLYEANRQRSHRKSS